MKTSEIPFIKIIIGYFGTSISLSSAPPKPPSRTSTAALDQLMLTPFGNAPFHTLGLPIYYSQVKETGNFASGVVLCRSNRCRVSALQQATFSCISECEHFSKYLLVIPHSTHCYVHPFLCVFTVPFLQFCTFARFNIESDRDR